MFDTIIMKNKIEINVQGDLIIDSATGEIIKSKPVIIKDEHTTLKYYPHSDLFLFQASIPKLLYGNNIQMIRQFDIPRFFERVDEITNKHFNVTIPKEDWIRERIDVCYNYKVQNVSEYIHALSKLSLPYKDTVTYNQSETVRFENGTSQIQFYNKQIESDNEAAVNILRMEIRPSWHDMEKYSLSKRVIDFLTLDYFKWIVDRYIKDIQSIPQQETQYDLEWLQSMPIGDVEKIMAYNWIVQEYGEQTAKKLYASSFYNRKKLYRNNLLLLNEIIPPSQLKPQYRLHIDYDQIS